MAIGTNLVEEIQSVLKTYQSQRDPLECKWNRNYAAYSRNHLHDQSGWLSPDFQTSEKEDDPESWQSSTVPDITKQKVVSATSLVSDVLFVGGKLNFALKDETLDSEARAGPSAPEGAGLDVPGVVDPIEENQKLIHRQLDECDAPAHLERCVLSAALYGRCYAKRFVRVSRNERLAQDETGEVYFEQEERKDPAIEYKSVWNIFRDESCSLEESDAVIETAWRSPYHVRKLRDKSNVIAENLREVLEQSRSKAGDRNRSGADSQRESPLNRNLRARRNTVRMVEFWGRLPRKLVEDFEAEMQSMGEDGNGPPMDPEDEQEAGDDVEVMVLLADDIPVRFSRTKPEWRPYFTSDWEERLDDVCPIGVADNVEVEQTVLTTVVRAIEDNVKQSAKVVWGVIERFVIGGLPKWLRPGQVLALEEEAKSVDNALKQLETRSVISELIQVIELYLGFADTSSMLPRAAQGQQVDTPQTAYELRERLEKAGKYLGRVIGRLDGMVERIVAAFLRQNMLDPDASVPKLPLTVKSLGFTSFENRVTRVQRLMELLTMAMQNEPLAQISKIRWLWKEILVATDVDPDNILKTAAELEADAQAEQAQLMAQQQAADGGESSPELQIRMQESQAKIAQLTAQAELAREQILSVRNKDLLERAKTVSQLRDEDSQFGAGAAAAGQAEAQPQPQEAIPA